MAEKVGDIYYDVTVETGRMIDAQREIERRARETASSLGAMGGGAKTAESGFRSAGAAAQEASGRFRDAAGKLRETLATYEKQRDLILLGAYQYGSDAKVDYAIDKIEAIEAYLKQPTDEGLEYDDIVDQLVALFAD